MLETAELSLREVIANLQIDMSLLIKYKCNERQLSKEFLKQIAYKMLGEENGLEVLEVVEEKVVYLKSQRQ